MEYSFFIENKTIFTVFHVLSVIIGMGSAIISDILFTFFGKDKVLDNSERKTLSILSTTVWYSLIVIVLSGFFIYLSDTVKYNASQKFISKMILMIVLLVNGFILHKIVQPHLFEKGFLKFKNKKSLRQLAFSCGAVSISTWFIICILGLIKKIPIHFSQFILGYIIFLVVAIVIALFIEKREFGK